MFKIRLASIFRRCLLQLVAVCVACCGFLPQAASAAGPTDDSALVSWFVVATDPHVGNTVWSKREYTEKRLQAFVNDMNAVVRPQFVVWTGDISDGGPFPDEEVRDDYRAFLRCTEKLKTRQYVLAGNHDKKPLFTEFFSEDTAAADGRFILNLMSTFWEGYDGTSISPERLERWKNAGLVNESTRPIRITATHCPPSEWNLPLYSRIPVGERMQKCFQDGGEALLKACRETGSVLYLCGHFHDWKQIVKGSPAVIQCLNLRRGFTIVGFCGDCMGIGFFVDRKWPAVVVLTPQRQELCGTRMCTVQGEFEVRALIFSPDPVVEVRCRIGKEPWQSMEAGIPPLYSTNYSTDKLADGGYMLTVSAKSGKGQASEQAIPIAIDNSGTYLSHAIIPIGVNWWFTTAELLKRDRDVSRGSPDYWTRSEHSLDTDQIWFEAAERPPAKAFLHRFTVPKGSAGQARLYLWTADVLPAGVWLDGKRLPLDEAGQSVKASFEISVPGELLSEGEHVLAMEMSEDTLFQAELWSIDS